MSGRGGGRRSPGPKRGGGPSRGGGGRRGGGARKPSSRSGEAGGRNRSRGGASAEINPPRQSAGGKGLGGDQVEGRHAVRELLIAGTRRVREVVMADDLDPASIIEEIEFLATEANVTLKRVPRHKFEGAARTTGPQGVMAFAAAIEPVTLDELVQGRDEPPFLLLLDGVTDPGNLGALLRTAECAGVTGVVLPKHRAVHLTPTVAKSAAGAIEHLRFATVSGLPAAIAELQQHGVWTVGLDMATDSRLWGFSMAADPVALVLGAEGRGLSRLVRERCDLVVSIPMAGRLDSLNVSAAGALAMFEVTRARATSSPRGESNS